VVEPCLSNPFTARIYKNPLRRQTFSFVAAVKHLSQGMDASKGAWRPRRERGGFDRRHFTSIPLSFAFDRGDSRNSLPSPDYFSVAAVKHLSQGMEASEGAWRLRSDRRHFTSLPFKCRFRPQGLSKFPHVARLFRSSPRSNIFRRAWRPRRERGGLEGSMEASLRSEALYVTSF